MLPYQRQVADAFLKFLSPKTINVLEIGSDMGGEVASAVAKRIEANVIGINPSSGFPVLSASSKSNVKFIRADGRFIPFADNSFDAILSVATMEHVNGLDELLAEVTRVLKPRGIFFTEFYPLWSSAKGHHVYAVVGTKEARFWKPGKNPIPNYAHLLMTPDEMRAYLNSGPCSEELIEPIIQWIYFCDSLNRCHFEEYMEAFRKCFLIVQDMKFGNEHIDSETRSKLHFKYGRWRNFNCSSISGVLRKPPEGTIYSQFFRGYLTLQFRFRFILRILLTPFSLLINYVRIVFH